MNVLIEVIDHTRQRYPTVGDWLYATQVTCPACSYQQIFEQGEVPQLCGCGSQLSHKELLIIRVSALDDWSEEMLIAFHEFVEVLQCKREAISQESVDKFDMDFEKNRQEGDESEPGDHPDAPYHKQHQIAMGFERMFAAVLGVDWNKYEDKIASMP